MGGVVDEVRTYYSQGSKEKASLVHLLLVDKSLGGNRV